VVLIDIALKATYRRTRYRYLGHAVPHNTNGTGMRRKVQHVGRGHGCFYRRDVRETAPFFQLYALSGPANTENTPRRNVEPAIKKSICSSSLLSSPAPSNQKQASTSNDKHCQDKLKANKTCLTKQKHTTNTSRKRKPTAPNEIPHEKRICLPSTTNHARLFSAQPVK